MSYTWLRDTIGVHCKKGTFSNLLATVDSRGGCSVNTDNTRFCWKFPDFSPISLPHFPILWIWRCEITTFTWSVSAPVCC